MLSAEDDDHSEADAAIRDITRRLGVTGPAAAETASQIYLAAKKGRIRFGYSFRQIQAAAVYASCRLFGVPRTLKEVASVCDLDFIPLASCYRRVVEDAGLTMPIPDPASYVSGISSRAGLDGPTELRAIEIINAAKRLRTTEGKAPTAIAAAALYMAYMELHPEESLDPRTRVTQQDIAEAAGISEVTLRNRVRTISTSSTKSRSGEAEAE
jgi:transcription initiation factor TFIIB